MAENRRRGLARAAVAALFGALALAMTVGLLVASPARGQTTYPVTSLGTAPGISTTTTVLAPTTQKAALAFTGTDVALTMGAAAVALGAGGVLVLASRKRRSAR